MIATKQTANTAPPADELGYVPFTHLFGVARHDGTYGLCCGSVDTRGIARRMEAYLVADKRVWRTVTVDDAVQTALF